MFTIIIIIVMSSNRQLSLVFLMTFLTPTDY